MSDELPEMRASDAERERVAEVLRDALEEGRLDVEEFQERVERTYEARTRGELAPLVRDLPQVREGAGGAQAAGAGLPDVAGAAGTASAPSVRKRRWPDRIGGTATSRWGLGLMGSFGRKGEWTVPRTFTGIGLMGGGELDLREAHFEGRDTVIRCFALMGGMNIIVPPGLGVEVRGIGIMGGFDSSASGFGDPDAPRVVITGLAIMGGVGVARKLPREEKRQLRAERRERRQLERRARREGRERASGHGHFGGHGEDEGRGGGRGDGRGDGRGGDGDPHGKTL